MKRPIELIQYRAFEEDILALDILTAAEDTKDGYSQSKHVDYDLEYHLEKGTTKTNTWFKELQEFILDLADDIIESPRKNYVAYRVIRNFACLENHKNHLFLYLKLNPENENLKNDIVRDVREIGHFGTGDLELRIEKDDHIEIAKEYLKRAYENNS